MRVERIEIDGFGRFHDAAWELPDGLTVLLGANEAGKTTLLNALRALLFGFEASRDGRAWYPALAGGRRGGRLVLRTRAGERWTVERHGERGGLGALVVRAPSGNQGGQETLARLLHGADRDLFNNVFAFGLGELQTMSSLSADGVRGRIYGAGAGLGGTSALDLERRLRQALDATFLPRGSQRPLNQLLARIEEVRAEVAGLARQPEEHAAAHAEREALRRRSDELRAAGAEARARLARIRRLRAAGPVAARLAAAEAELAAGDASLDRLPPDAVTILERLDAGVDQARAVLVTVEEQLAEARRLRDALAVDQPVLMLADEIAALAAEHAGRSAAADRRRDLTLARARAEAAVGEQLSRAGSGWTEATLVALDDSIPSVEATRAHEATMAEAEMARREAEARHRRAQEEVARLGPVGDGPEALDDTALADRTAALRELDGLRLALAAARSGMPPGRRLTWALAGALLAAAAAFGWAIGAPLPGLAMGAALAAAAIVAGRGGSSHGAATLRARRDVLLERLGLPSAADDADIAAVAEELAVARARRQMASAGAGRSAAATDELERLAEELAEADTRLAAARAAWSAWLGEQGLPPDASPDAVRHLLIAAGTARRAAAEREHHAVELAGLEADDARWRSRIDRLLAAAGVAPAGDDEERRARLAALVERRDRAIADRRRAAELDDQIARLELRRAPAADAVAAREAAVAVHLEALGCADRGVLRRRAADAAARRELHAAIREERKHLLGIAGSGEAVEPLLAELRGTDPATLEVAEAEAGAALESIEAAEREAQHRIGALTARLRELEAAEELGARRQELAILEGRAVAMARDWAVRAVALRLLEETRARYERDRQPDVVRAAEAHFERITAGRYGRIVAPPGAGGVRVETEGGESRTTDELSRGTAEQLYLALRFGLIEEFARQAEPLPVVMDDILVNFDAERAERAAAAIRSLAERHQVLYFTCHAPTAAMLDPDGARTLALG